MRPRRVLEFVLIAFAATQIVVAQKFYPDDPLLKEPASLNASNVKVRKLNDYYDLLQNTFKHPGDHGGIEDPIPARGVNTLGEPMDGPWYVHRHYWNPMTTEELMRGPGGKTPPSQEGVWTVVSAKSEGITPGFVMKDSVGNRYFVKFDPISNPEMATGAEMISARLFYALGYHVPDYYLIYFTSEKLVLADDVEFRDSQGRLRKMTQGDLRKLLNKIPTTKDGKFRGIASLQLEGKPVGPFRYYGTRSDDPNDTVPHEHRRELRGMYVFAAWINHNDARSINSLDTLVTENGTSFVRHHLIDFGSTLGSQSTQAKTARFGGEYYLDFKKAPTQMLTLGAAVPYWAHARYPDYPSIGRFEASTFRPDEWLPDYPNSAFLNRLPDDDFWAAKQVMAFTDEQLRAIVKVAEFSDPDAERYLVDTLIARRDKIGRTFFAKVLPLDRFEVRQDTLVFHDLAKEYGLASDGEVQVAWSRFDNKTSQKMAIPDARGFQVPDPESGGSEPSYVVAELWRGADCKKTVTVYLKELGGQTTVVGIDRTW